MSHWSEKYIGEPWVSTENDCWAFVRRVWLEQFQLSVPAVDVDAHSQLACVRAFSSHEEISNWKQVDTPCDGDGVLIGKNRRPSHVGIYVSIGSGRILHCVQGVGVICQDLQSMAFMGLRPLGYYQRIVK